MKEDSLLESNNPPLLFWDKSQLARFFEPIRAWLRSNTVPTNRIIVGEYGVFRQNRGSVSYLTDLIDLFKREGWHWAFYSFREGTWPGMDYELGEQLLSQEWWDACERAKIHLVLMFRLKISTQLNVESIFDARESIILIKM